MPCKCQQCGEQYKVDLIVSDWLWEQIKPKGKPKGAGMLCGPCIMKNIESFGYYDSLHLEDKK